ALLLMPSVTPRAQEPQKLPVVSVTAPENSRDAKVLKEIQQRSLVSSGTQILPGNSTLQTAIDASDVIRIARGFTIKGPTVVQGRPYMDPQGRLLPCLSRRTDYLDERGVKPGTVYKE